MDDCWASKIKLAPPCEGEVKYREHFKMYLCDRHHIESIQIPELNDMLSESYKEFWKEESHKWQY